MKLSLYVGMLALRFAARQFNALKYQLPPRPTRPEPDEIGRAHV